MPTDSLQNMPIVLRSRSRNMSFTNEIIQAFAPITLAEMSGVALMERRDTKYLFHGDTLPALLATLDANGPIHFIPTTNGNDD